jgi:hypothetical protein
MCRKQVQQYACIEPTTLIFIFIFSLYFAREFACLIIVCVFHALRAFFTTFQGYLKVSVAVLGPNDQRVAYELDDGGNSSSSSSSSSARNSADSSVERNADGWEVIKNCEYPKAMKLKSWGIKANLFRAEHLPVSGMRWSHTALVACDAEAITCTQPIILFTAEQTKTQTTFGSGINRHFDLVWFQQYEPF